MKKVVPFIIVAVGLTGCFKVPDGSPSTAVPTYKLYINSYNDISDTAYYFQMIDSGTSTLPLTFKILSGSATDYALTCSLDSLPVGVSVAEGPQTFKLNNYIKFNLSATPTAPTGFYKFQIKVQVGAGDTKLYPIRVKIFPR